MNCKINKETYDKIVYSINNKELETFEIIPYHKGLEITINFDHNNSNFNEIKNLLAEFYFQNNFEYGGYFIPIIEKNILSFDFESVIEIEIREEDIDSFNINKLIEILKPFLIDIIGENIDNESLYISINMNSFNLNEISYYDYSIIYYSIVEEKDIDLSNNEDIKNKVIEFIKNWAITKCWAGDRGRYNFEVSIEQSTPNKLIEYVYKKINLEINDK